MANSYIVWVGANRLERARRMYDTPKHHIMRRFERTGVWVVQSQRFATRTYRVHPTSPASCTCEDFVTNRPLQGPSFVCKHLILVWLVKRKGRLLRPPQLGASLHLNNGASETGTTMSSEVLTSDAGGVFRALREMREALVKGPLQITLFDQRSGTRSGEGDGWTLNVKHTDLQTRPFLATLHILRDGTPFPVAAYWLADSEALETIVAAEGYYTGRYNDNPDSSIDRILEVIEATIREDADNISHSSSRTYIVQWSVIERSTIKPVRAHAGLLVGQVWEVEDDGMYEPKVDVDPPRSMQLYEVGTEVFDPFGDYMELMLLWRQAKRKMQRTKRLNIYQKRKDSVYVEKKALDEDDVTKLTAFMLSLARAPKDKGHYQIDFHLDRFDFTVYVKEHNKLLSAFMKDTDTEPLHDIDKKTKTLLKILHDVEMVEEHPLYGVALRLYVPKIGWMPTMGRAAAAAPDLHHTWAPVDSVSTINAVDTTALLARTLDMPEFRVRLPGGKVCTKWSLEINNDTATFHLDDTTIEYDVSHTKDMLQGKTTSDRNTAAERAVLVQFLASAARAVHLPLVKDVHPTVLHVDAPSEATHLNGAPHLRVVSLTPAHAFVGNAITGKAVCGHVHSAAKLERWANVEGVESCPTCTASDDMPLVITLGAGKRKTAEKMDQASYDAWMAKERARVLEWEAKPESEKTKAAQKEWLHDSVAALEALPGPPSNFSVMVMRRLYGVPDTAKRGDPQGDEEKRLRAYLESVATNPQGKWTRPKRSAAARTIIAKLYNLPLDDNLKTLVQHEWLDMVDGAVGRAGKTDGDDDKKKKRPRVTPGEGKEEAEPTVVEVRTTQNDMLERLKGVLPERPDLNFIVYGRNMCNGETLKDLGVGTLSSYQKVVQWSAERMASNDASAPLSTLFFHDTGSGKTCSMWLALGTAWKQERFRPKLLFVAPQTLANKQDAAKDVWCFYHAAGANSYDTVREGPSSKQSKSKGEDWRYFIPAQDPARPVTKRDTRIVSFTQFANALMVRNRYGRMLYGYELVNNTGRPQLVKAIESPRDGRIGAGEFDDENDNLIHLLDNTAGVRSGRERGLSEDEAKDPTKNPIDPLRNAVIAFDEADTLFSPTSVLSTKQLERIERVIFRSYAISGKNAVRLVLATATPAHTDVRSTFRLLNMLVMDPKERVHGVGTYGTGTTSTVVTLADLRGKDGDFQTESMRRYMRMIRNNVSRVDVTEDLDHFPIRNREDVDVQFAGDAERILYDNAIARRYRQRDDDDTPMTSVRIGQEDDEEEGGGGGRVLRPRRGPAAGADDSDEDFEDLLKAEEAAAEAAAKEDADEPKFTEVADVDDVQRVLNRRANNLRALGMMLPPDGLRVGVVPPSMRLGHNDFDRAATAAHMAARAPKMVALMQRIREIDEKWMLEHGYLPKHAVMSAVPNVLGAPLIGAALNAAGYYWRPMQRDRAEGITFDVPSPEAKERFEEGTEWEQHPPGSSPGLPAPYDQSNAAFVVLDGSLLSMHFEQRYERPENTMRSYADHIVVGVRDLERLAPLGPPREADWVNTEPPSDEEIAQRKANYDATIRRLARKPLYTSTLDRGIYASASQGRITFGAELQRAGADVPPGLGERHHDSIDKLRTAGLAEWAPSLTARQRRKAPNVMFKHFNDQTTNRDGEFARIVVMAPQFTTGTDLAAVEFVHLVDPPERVESGIGGNLRTRDRIQVEGRAWRRCGHGLIRDLRHHGLPTTVNVISYNLNGAGVDSSTAMSLVRKRRPLPAGVEDTSESYTMQADDIAAALIRDPVEQAQLSTLIDFVEGNAFDRVANTVRAPEAPVYTGYILVRGSEPLYRPADGGFSFVHNDATPMGVLQEGDRLYGMWRNATVRYAPNYVGKGVIPPDAEQAAIEEEWLDWVRAEVRYIVGTQYGAMVENPMQRRYEETLERWDAADTKMSFDDRRAYVEDAIAALGVKALYAQAYEMSLQAIDKAKINASKARAPDTHILRNIVAHLNRRRYERGARLDQMLKGGLTEGYFDRVLPDDADKGFALLQGGWTRLWTPSRTVADAGPVFTQVMDLAGRMGTVELGDLLHMFHRMWGLNIANVLSGISQRQRVPGETPEEYRRVLFQNLANVKSKRWSRITAAAQEVFLPPDLPAGKKGPKEKAKDRINLSLATQASRGTDDLSAAARFYIGGDDVDEGVALGWVSPDPRDAWSPLMRYREDILSTLRDPEDFVNHNLALAFAVAYIEVLEMEASGMPTPLYARIYRLATRMGLGVASLVAKYMTFSVNVKSVRASAPVVGVAAQRALLRKDRELEAAFTYALAGSRGEAELQRVMEGFDGDGRPIDIVQDAVPALFAADGDLPRMHAVIDEATKQRDNPTGIRLHNPSVDLLHNYNTLTKSTQKLHYYDSTGQRVEVSNITGKSWPETLARWLLDDEATISDWKQAAAMFSAKSLREVTLQAVVYEYGGVPPAQSQTTRGTALRFVRARVTGKASEGPLSLREIAQVFDNLVDESGRTDEGVSYKNMDTEDQQDLLLDFGRTFLDSPTRVWRTIEGVADKATPLFALDNTPQAHRTVRRAFFQALFAAEKQPSTIPNKIKLKHVDTDSPDHVAEVLYHPSIKPVWDSLLTPRDSALLLIGTQAHMVGAFTVTTAAAAAGATAPQIPDITSGDVLEWFLSLSPSQPVPATPQAAALFAATNGQDIFDALRGNEDKRAGARRRVEGASIGEMLPVERLGYFAQKVAAVMESERTATSAAGAAEEEEEEGGGTDDTRNLAAAHTEVSAEVVRASPSSPNAEDTTHRARVVLAALAEELEETDGDDPIRVLTDARDKVQQLIGAYSFAPASSTAEAETSISTEIEEDLFGDADADVVMTSASFVRVPARPMRIVAPAHLHGEIIHPDDAKRLVWTKHAASDSHLIIAEGHHTLANGTLLDPWTEDEDILVELF